ncbi:MAG: hypothetical protein AMXMBFR77_18860 [Phycisphaerales bacterium]|nr:hypothetical protein [cyanobacterium CYA1]MCZ7633873.1 sulfotransferase [Phycisphaerales bacterium]MDL1904258.1 tetratricopeptide repeat protein [Synechococcales cyanobacterium CNB]GIK19489.1 MAG: hypothetical protein BroJett004_16530 [Planctomycetota bacterium]
MIIQGQSQRIHAIRQAVNAQQWVIAEELLQEAVQRGRPDAEMLYYMGIVHEVRFEIDAALEYGERSMRLLPNPGAALLIARAHRLRGETDEAVRMCDRALELAPGNVLALATKAGSLEEAGRYDESLAVVEPLLERAKQQDRQAEAPILAEWAKLLIQQKRYEEAIGVIDDLIANHQPDERRRCGLLYTRAKACDKAKDYEGAFRSAEEANRFEALPFDPEVYREQVTALMTHWSREKMAKFPISSCASEVPVFVAGMPRSGTSLIDQIIDAHPRAAGVGELDTIDRFAIELAAAWNPDLEPPESFGPFNSRRWTQVAERYVREVRRLAPTAERIVNKSLGNNRLVGLIARLFPRTRIIHAIRDPRDVAVSCFMGGFNNRMHPWTTRIDWVVAAWEQSMRMMEHWKSSLDVPILDVHYERLVNDPETEFPRIIEFLGLEWDDACNEFHKSRRTVRTLSYDQVNRPLYTTSAGRNQHYAKFLEGVKFPAYDPYA